MRLVPCICNHCGKGCQYAFAPVPHVPPSAPPRGAEGGEGEGEGRPPGVRRSAGPETVETLFQRVTKTYALPANTSLTMMEIPLSGLIKRPGFDHTLRLPESGEGRIKNVESSYLCRNVSHSKYERHWRCLS